MFSLVSRWSSVVLVGAALITPSLASAQTVEAPPGTVGRALQQPFRDLNLIHSRTASVLELAATDPYDASGLDDCTVVRSRIDELEGVLGPDIDGPPRAQSSAASQLAAGAVGSVVGLPFSGVIRHLSGAYSQDLTHRRAVLAGMVRRGYLNGVWRTMGCDASKIAGPAQPPVSPDPGLTDLPAPQPAAG
ncbi:MAG: hypothetical protein WCI21_04525 [Alphaproteobacteria bacterium]